MSNRLVCITGGYGRLGIELAKAFGDNDDTVIITGRCEAKLNSAAGKLQCDAFVHDVTNEKNTHDLVKYIDAKYHRLDVLVNNAGIMRSSLVAEMEPDLFLEVIKTNVYGPFLCTRFLLPLLQRSSSGLIINISSTSGHRADPGASAYNASKFGLMGFTEAVRKELRHMNIRVTTVSPSSIVYNEPTAGGEKIGLTGQDVANAAVFLANNPGRALVRDIELWATNP